MNLRKTARRGVAFLDMWPTIVSGREGCRVVGREHECCGSCPRHSRKACSRGRIGHGGQHPVAFEPQRGIRPAIGRVCGACWKRGVRL